MGKAVDEGVDYRILFFSYKIRDTATVFPRMRKFFLLLKRRSVASVSLVRPSWGGR